MASTHAYDSNERVFVLVAANVLPSMVGFRSSILENMLLCREICGCSHCVVGDVVGNPLLLVLFPLGVLGFICLPVGDFVLHLRIVCTFLACLGCLECCVDSLVCSVVVWPEPLLN